MIGYKAWFVPKRGGVCPVLVVGEERGFWVVWKLINGVVLERVVPKDTVFASNYWKGNLEL